MIREALPSGMGMIDIAFLFVDRDGILQLLLLRTKHKHRKRVSITLLLRHMSRKHPRTRPNNHRTSLLLWE